MNRATSLLQRKEALGRSATFQRIADGTSASRETVRLVLRGEESSGAIPINRERIMDEVEEALDVIEQERKLADAA